MYYRSSGLVVYNWLALALAGFFTRIYAGLLLVVFDFGRENHDKDAV